MPVNVPPCAAAEDEDDVPSVLEEVPSDTDAELSPAGTSDVSLSPVFEHDVNNTAVLKSAAANLMLRFIKN